MEMGTKQGYDKVTAFLIIIVGIIHEVDTANMDGKISWKEWLSIMTSTGGKLILLIGSFNEAWEQLKTFDFDESTLLAKEIEERLYLRNARTEKYIEMAIRLITYFVAYVEALKDIKA